MTTFPRPGHYLAAPLAHPTPVGRRWHRDRATIAARLLGATIVPHRHIAPLYAPGYPDEGETPEQRAAAMAACLAAVDGCDRLSVLTLYGGQLSPGCAAEVERYREGHATEPLLYDWHGLRVLVSTDEDLREWRRLVRP